MKKIIITAALLLPMLFAASCSMFELDNYDGPNAEVTGKFYDVVTGEKQGIEAATYAPYAAWGYYDYVILRSGALTVTELNYISPNWTGNPEDYHAEGEQTWLVRFDGQYTNTRVFAAEYRFSNKLLPFYEPEEGKNTFTLKKGRNKVDIGVLPFCRIKDPKIRYDASAKKMVATFYVELTDPSRANKISNVAFCGNTSLFVGCNYQNLAKDDPGAKAKNVTPGELVTLEIDLQNTANSNLFGRNLNTGEMYVQDRYFRIAAEADGNGFNSSKLYNFSPIYKVSADFGTIEEAVWDDVDW